MSGILVAVAVACSGGEGNEIMSLFEIDTAVESRGEDRFRAVITDRWNGLAGRPLGGYVLAVCLRALREAMPVSDLFAASAFYLHPVDPGPVEVRTEIARVGRRSAVGEARLYQNGAEALRTVAEFTGPGLFGGQNLIAAEPPDLPPPSQAFSPYGGSAPSAVSVIDRVEYRVADSPGRSRKPGTGSLGTEAARTTLWMRLAEGGMEDLLAIALLADAAPPAVLEIGATGSTTLELTIHVRSRPRSQWLACQALTRFVIDGHHEEDFEMWDETGRLVAQSRQLARLPRSDSIGAVPAAGERRVGLLAPSASGECQ